MALAQPINESPLRLSPLRTVLIISDKSEDGLALGETLKTKSFTTITSILSGNNLSGIPRQSPDAVLLYFSQESPRLKAISNALRARYEAKNVPIIGIFGRDWQIDANIVDTVMYMPVHPAQIAHRINSMIRLTIMQTEIAMRMDTLREDFGIDYRLNPDSFGDRLRVLFIGKATPEFMIIINALERKDVEVFAAFTSFTAFDFLHETSFDAVVMNALNGLEPGLTIAQTMKRNSNLYHTPALLLGRRGQIETDEAYQNGISDILYNDSNEKDLQDRVLELARFHKLHRQVKLEFDNLGQAECHDESGAYNLQFFSKHLSRLIDVYAAQDLPVSILTVEVDIDTRIAVEPLTRSLILNQVGSMIKNMVRVYDVTGRISQNVYSIAFPGQSSASLDPVVKRISALSKTSEFGPDPSGRLTYKIDLKIDSAELGPGVTGESWLANHI